MRRAIVTTLAIVGTLGMATTFSQSGASAPPNVAIDFLRTDITKVADAPRSNENGGDRILKVIDMGPKYNLAVAVIRRAKTPKAAPDAIGGLNHVRLTEVYYITSGSGTMVTGGTVKDIRPMAADNFLVTNVVGPSNNATFIKPAQSRVVNEGDVIVIPAGVYHGFSEVPDHIEYVLIRPDVEKVLPAGYVNSVLKE